MRSHFPDDSFQGSEGRFTLRIGRSRGEAPAPTDTRASRTNVCSFTHYLSVVAVSWAFHVAEEYLTGWQEWARQTLGIVMPTFLVANAVLVVVALLLARLGWRRPALSLVIPSATLVNALFLHILPTVVQRRVSPGNYTAALLYVPFSSWALVGAARDGVARTAIAVALIAGTLMMAIVVLAAKWLSNAGFGVYSPE